MGFSISQLTNFENINWHNFERRPPITKDMPQCSNFNWEYDIPCCTDGYVISDTLQMAAESGKLRAKESIFLASYPCVNSLEFEDIVDNIFQTNSLQGINEYGSASPFRRIFKLLRDIF